MKIKTISLILIVFFTGMICFGTHVLAEDPPDSVLDDLQPPPGQNPNPTVPEEYEQETTPEGDPKKPPAPDRDGNPVKYSDEEGDWYWGTDGHLYPWPPPKKIKKKPKKTGPGGLVQDADGGWSGTIGGVKFSGFKAKEKTPKDIKKEKEEGEKKKKEEEEKKKKKDKPKGEIFDAAIPGKVLAESVQYVDVKKGKSVCTAGILYRTTPEGMEVEVTALATGKGSNYRKWEVTGIKLNIDGDKVRPVTSDNFYSTTQSFVQGPAVVMFTAIGAQYGRYADQAGSGEVCPVTGKKTGSGGMERGPTARAIDSAGMAAGLGLLTSQAKGEITGKKAKFKLDKDQQKKISEGKGGIEINVENRNTGKRQRFKVPLAAVDAPVKITPGASDGTPLSKRSIPYYYDQSSSSAKDN